MELGERLKTARALAGLTQAQVAGKVHVTRTTISNWETGRSYPDIASLLTLSQLYRLSLDTLIREDAQMITELKRKEQERRLAGWTQWVAVAVSTGITLMFLGQKFAVPGLTMGATTRGCLLALLWLNLIVVGLTARRYRRLKTVDSRADRAKLVVGGLLTAGAVVAMFDPQHRVEPLLLALLVGGAGVLLWRGVRRQRGE